MSERVDLPINKETASLMILQSNFLKNFCIKKIGLRNKNACSAYSKEYLVSVIYNEIKKGGVTLLYIQSYIDDLDIEPYVGWSTFLTTSRKFSKEYPLLKVILKSRTFSLFSVYRFLLENY